MLKNSIKRLVLSVSILIPHGRVFGQDSIETTWDYCGIHDRKGAECVRSIGPDLKNCLYDGRTGQCFTWEFISDAIPNNCPEDTPYRFSIGSWISFADSDSASLKLCQSKGNPCNRPMDRCHIRSRVKIKRS